MKIIQSTSIIILLLISGPLMAAQWMLGASFGNAWGESESSQLNSDLAGRGINATVSDIENSRSMTQLFIGYVFLPPWGVELAYVDLGDVEASINGTINGIDNYFTSGQDLYPQTATGWQLSGVYRFPVSGSLQLIARLGAYSWTTNYTIKVASESQSVSDDGIDITYGLGLETGKWIMEGGIVGQLNWEHYSVNDEIVNVLAVGVSYRF